MDILQDSSGEEIIVARRLARRILKDRKQVRADVHSFWLCEKNHAYFRPWNCSFLAYFHTNSSPCDNLPYHDMRLLLLTFR